MVLAVEREKMVSAGDGRVRMRDWLSKDDVFGVWRMSERSRCAAESRPLLLCLWAGNGGRWRLTAGNVARQEHRRMDDARVCEVK